MRRTAAPLLAIALALPLAACGAARDYPSLERRPVERMTGSARPVSPEQPPAPPTPASAELTARLAQLVEQARAAHQRFLAKRGTAERLVSAAGGSAPGTESWSVATVALSDMQSARSDAMVALAELDQIYVRESVRAAELDNRASVAAIEAARDRVMALVGEQDEVLAALLGRMRA